MRLALCISGLCLLFGLLVSPAMADASVTINVSQLSQTAAQLDIDGDPGGKPGCQIELRAGSYEESAGGPILQTISCADWTGGPRSYQVSGLAPGSQYTATLNIPGYAWPWITFWTTTASEPASVSIDVPTSGITKHTAQIVLTGSAGTATGCEIKVRTGWKTTGALAQTISCDDWSAGEKSYTATGLEPGTNYSVSVTLANELGTSTAWDRFTTALQGRQCPKPNPAAPNPCENSPKFSLSFHLACSRQHPGHASHRCPMGSKPVAVLRSSRSTSYRACIQTAQYGTRCTRKLSIRAGQRRVFGINRTFGLNSRTWMTYSVSIETSQLGPKASRTMRIYRGR